MLNFLGWRTGDVQNDGMIMVGVVENTGGTIFKDQRILHVRGVGYFEDHLRELYR